MAVYWLSSPFAALIGFMLGGALSARYGWRMTFLLMGIPGLFLAIIVKLTVREPRLALDSGRHSTFRPARLREVCRVLVCRRACRNLSLAIILFYSLGLGLAPWQAAFMMRSHGMGTEQLGIWMGSILGAGGVAGVILGGYVASHRFAEDERGQLRVTALVVAALTPLYLAFLLLPGKYEALIAFIPLTVAFSFFLAPAYALLQRLVPDEMRATVMAIVMLLANLIGMGVGTQIVGILSDALQPTLGVDALRYAMLVVAFIALWSGAHFWKAGSTIREELLT